MPDDNRIGDLQNSIRETQGQVQQAVSTGQKTASASSDTNTQMLNRSIADLGAKFVSLTKAIAELVKATDQSDTESGRDTDKLEGAMKSLTDALNTTRGVGGGMSSAAGASGFMAGMAPGMASANMGWNSNPTLAGKGGAGKEMLGTLLSTGTGAPSSIAGFRSDVNSAMGGTSQLWPDYMQTIQQVKTLGTEMTAFGKGLGFVGNSAMDAYRRMQKVGADYGQSMQQSLQQSQQILQQMSFTGSPEQVSSQVNRAYKSATGRAIGYGMAPSEMIGIQAQQQQLGMDPDRLGNSIGVAMERAQARGSQGQFMASINQLLQAQAQNSVTGPGRSGDINAAFVSSLYKQNADNPLARSAGMGVMGQFTQQSGQTGNIDNSLVYAAVQARPENRGKDMIDIIGQVQEMSGPERMQVLLQQSFHGRTPTDKELKRFNMIRGISPNNLQAGVVADRAALDLTPEQIALQHAQSDTRAQLGLEPDKGGFGEGNQSALLDALATNTDPGKKALYDALQKSDKGKAFIKQIGGKDAFDKQDGAVLLNNYKSFNPGFDITKDDAFNDVSTQLAQSKARTETAMTGSVTDNLLTNIRDNQQKEEGKADLAAKTMDGILKHGQALLNPLNAVMGFTGVIAGNSIAQTGLMKVCCMGGGKLPGGGMTPGGGAGGTGTNGIPPGKALTVEEAARNAGKGRALAGPISTAGKALGTVTAIGAIGGISDSALNANDGRFGLPTVDKEGTQGLGLGPLLPTHSSLKDEFTNTPFTRSVGWARKKLGFASGGTVPTTVGERGMEAINLRPGDNVTPMSSLINLALSDPSKQPATEKTMRELLSLIQQSIRSQGGASGLGAYGFGLSGAGGSALSSGTNLAVIRALLGGTGAFSGNDNGVVSPGGSADVGSWGTPDVPTGGGVAPTGGGGIAPGGGGNDVTAPGGGEAQWNKFQPLDYDSYLKIIKDGSAKGKQSPWGNEETYKQLISAAQSRQVDPRALLAWTKLESGNGTTSAANLNAIHNYGGIQIGNQPGATDSGFAEPGYSVNFADFHSDENFFNALATNLSTGSYAQDYQSGNLDAVARRYAKSPGNRVQQTYDYEQQYPPGPTAPGTSGGGGRTKPTPNPTRSAGPQSITAQSVTAIKARAGQTAGTPYVYGGGHGSADVGGFDCSGYVVDLLHAGGINVPYMTAGGLYAWSKTGEGAKILDAAGIELGFLNPGAGGQNEHVAMKVDGVWYEDGGMHGPSAGASANAAQGLNVFTGLGIPTSPDTLPDATTAVHSFGLVPPTSGSGGISQQTSGTLPPELNAFNPKSKLYDPVGVSSKYMQTAFGANVPGETPQQRQQRVQAAIDTHQSETDKQNRWGAQISTGTFDRYENADAKFDDANTQYQQMLAAKENNPEVLAYYQQAKREQQSHQQYLNFIKDPAAAKRDYLDSHIGAVGNVGNIDQAIANAGGFDYQPGRAQTAVGYDEANKAQAQKDLDNYQKGQGAPPTTVGGLRTDATGAAVVSFPPELIDYLRQIAANTTQTNTILTGQSGGATPPTSLYDRIGNPQTSQPPPRGGPYRRTNPQGGTDEITTRKGQVYANSDVLPNAGDVIDGVHVNPKNRGY